MLLAKLSMQRHLSQVKRCKTLKPQLERHFGNVAVSLFPHLHRISRHFFICTINSQKYLHFGASTYTYM